MEFQMIYFKSWKMWKCCTQYASKLGKLSSDFRTRKVHFSFPSQRKAMPKNAQTTTQLHSSHHIPGCLALGKCVWAKLMEVMEFQLSSFKSWKMTLWKCCIQYASKFGKLSHGHRTGKGQFSFQSQRKAMPKNAQTTVQLHSSHKLVK